jgi:hypothetical protein
MTIYLSVVTLALTLFQVVILVIALLMTRDHFRRSRAAHFIERFNGADAVSLTEPYISKETQ